MALQLVVVTPQGEKFSGEVDEVVLPGASGEFGVLEAHERFLSALEHGCMEIRTSEGSRYAAISNGFAEVTGEKVVVMVDSSLEVSEIDIEEARKNHADASAQLAQLPDGDEQATERADLEDALTRLAVQIQVAEK